MNQLKNLLLYIILCQYWTVCIRINDTFFYCDVINLHRVVSKEIDCSFSQLMKKDKWIFSNKSIWILTKNDYIINDYGYQCYKKKVVRFLNESLFFDKTDVTFKYNINLTGIECLAMISSKKCENNEMTCDDNGCYYKQIPQGGFFWGKSKPYTSFECAFHKKLIIGKNVDIPLFSFNKSRCTAKELYCKLYESIIIWDSSKLNLYEYNKLHYGTEYKKVGNTVFSYKDRLLFQLDKNITYLNETFFSTTDGLYIYVEENSSKSKSILDNFENIFARNKSILFQREINDLMLGETDFNEFVLQNSVNNNNKNSYVLNCNNFRNQLQLLSMFEDKLFSIIDMNENELILYSQFDQLFIPDCVKIDSIELRNEEECYLDIPVKIVVNSQTLKVFLTSNNFLKSFSKKLDCRLINDRVFLPQIKKVLVRNGNQIRSMEINNINIEKITINGKKNVYINFFHHEEIIKGYDFLNNFDQVNHLNDIDENFSVLPNDQIETNEDTISKILKFKDFLYNKVVWIKQFVYHCVVFVSIICLLFALFHAWQFYLSIRSRRI